VALLQCSAATGGVADAATDAGLDATPADSSPDREASSEEDGFVEWRLRGDY
jgi:hypothetical protein